MVSITSTQPPHTQWFGRLDNFNSSPESHLEIKPSFSLRWPIVSVKLSSQTFRLRPGCQVDKKRTRAVNEQRAISFMSGSPAHRKGHLWWLEKLHSMNGQSVAGRTSTSVLPLRRKLQSLGPIQRMFIHSTASAKSLLPFAPGLPIVNSFRDRRVCVCVCIKGMAIRIVSGIYTCSRWGNEELNRKPFPQLACEERHEADDTCIGCESSSLLLMLLLVVFFFWCFCRGKSEKWKQTQMAQTIYLIAEVKSCLPRCVLFAWYEFMQPMPVSQCHRLAQMKTHRPNKRGRR